MKKTISIILCIIIMITVTACNGANNATTQPSDNSDEIGKLLGGDSEDKNETSAIGMQFSGQYPEYMKGWNDGKDDTEVIYEYAGEEVTIPHHIQNGSFAECYGLCVMLNGVFQEFFISDDETGEKSEKTKILNFYLEKDIDKKIHIHFEPNIGQKGDILELSVGVFMDFDAYIKEDAEFANYGNSHDYRDVKCRRLKMLKDGKNTVKPVEVRTEQNSADKRISDVVDNLFDDEAVSLYFYTDFEKDLCGMSNIIYAKTGDKNTYNIDVAAPDGKYRTSIYIDHELQKDIDGNEYFDIEAQSGKMNHFEITLPENELKGWHHIYVMLRRIDGKYDYSSTTLKSGTKILAFE